MENYVEKAREVVSQVNRVILGKEREVEEVMLAFLAGGHILLEDIPEAGKTTLALAFSRAMELEHRRVQFTPDVMPSDLTGFFIYPEIRERMQSLLEQGEKLTPKQWKAEIQLLQAEYDSIGKETGRNFSSVELFV